MDGFPHPESRRKPQHFDPASFTRSVIALPLLEQIEEELAITKSVEEKHPHLRDKHNTAIFLNPKFSVDPKKALKAVRMLVDVAVKQLDLKTECSLDEPDPQISKEVVLANMDGELIRQLLALDAATKNPVIARIWPTRFDVIIDINLEFRPLANHPDTAAKDPDYNPDPRHAAKALVKDYIDRAKMEAGVTDSDQRVELVKTAVTNQYVFASLEGRVIKALVDIDRREADRLAHQADRATAKIVEQNLGRRSQATDKAVDSVTAPDPSRFRTIHQIWPDFVISRCITHSIRTVKIDAAQRSFTASGEGITWAVMDSGIDALHPHFRLHKNIDDSSPAHEDFTGSSRGREPLKDDFGHGTHVAGIIAGEQKEGSGRENLLAVWQTLEVPQDPAADRKKVTRKIELTAVSGMAPKCKLVSLKVLNEFGKGKASSVIAAIAHVQVLNGHGRDLKIHGVNLSLGHSFDPKWFACGHSPLCVEVNRLVKSGVVVVIAAGNTGYGHLQTLEGQSDTSLDLTINDPGNAEYAITVGSTHRDKPHLYGVSYFSSKGPTGDGRLKPDLLAPGERILSCAAKKSRLVQEEIGGEECAYFERSGTSMAAPHVSGAVAAFLSIRSEFIGEAEKVKKIFTSTATDLGRDRYFQGAGLVDLMRAIQSV